MLGTTGGLQLLGNWDMDGEGSIELRVRRLRARSEELRIMSEQMRYPSTMDAMIGLASTYDRFADWLEGRQNPSPVGADWQ